MKTESGKNGVQKDTVKDPKAASEKNMCNLSYLTETMGGKKKLIKEIMDVFLKQVPEELRSIEDAIQKTDYTAVKNIAHTMKSSVSIMGISVLEPILKEMENLGAERIRIEKIKELNQKLAAMCKQALSEIERERPKYV